ncbi:iron-sulfur cluster repair protein YtfE [Aliikangiella sp. G2MR2-5]|uniref:iron-sulfur cluster repair protein YtfE n=1 Tax=Aliikangiella sp. G2MR2-5 TaxID=2788943 RepID=UPI0018AB1E56|nr:iron-sulfur cluster repair protein YtfE [Aliikangiella sp. G2MR2-5]
MSYIDWPVGKIATEVPGATAVFFKNRINFCCDGKKILSDVIERKSLDKQPILQALQALSQRKEEQLSLEELTNQQVIGYVLQRFHEVHRDQLNELQRLAQRVETVHGKHPLCPTGLAQLLANMEAELEQHMRKEESILFPLLANNSAPMARGPISVMRAEHDDHLANIETIYELTNDVTPHEDACNTWRALYLGLQEFISDLNQHIHIENNILFNR